MTEKDTTPRSCAIPARITLGLFGDFHTNLAVFTFTSISGNSVDTRLEGKIFNDLIYHVNDMPVYTHTPSKKGGHHSSSIL
jgi:hypothetical protein